MASHKNCVFALLLAVLCSGMVCTAHAGDGECIWSALVLATNEEHPAEPSKDLADYTKQLKSIFGYNQYEMLGQHLESIDSPNEHWFVHSENFFLRVDCKKSEKAGYYRMKLDLWQEKKQLAEMEAKLSGQNLLFIRGPFYGNGQLIIVLMIK